MGLLVNWRAVEETASRPMLMLGTSSDRIGTPSGRAYYATLAKDLERHVGLPVAPYVGAAWGEFDAWIAAQGLAAAPDLWECYLAGPESGPDPTTWRTELNRPLVG